MKEGVSTVSKMIYITIKLQLTLISVYKYTSLNKVFKHLDKHCIRFVDKMGGSWRFRLIMMAENDQQIANGDVRLK